MVYEGRGYQEIPEQPQVLEVDDGEGQMISRMQQGTCRGNMRH